jgi:hypothetical protein
MSSPFSSSPLGQRSKSVSCGVQNGSADRRRRCVEQTGAAHRADGLIGERDSDGPADHSHDCAHCRWRDGHGKPGGRAEAARRLDEANPLFAELSEMLTEMRRDLLGGGRER